MSLVRLSNWGQKKRNHEESVMRSYLLGDVDETSRDDVELRLFTDKDYADRMSTAEDNLIDDYVFGGLSQSEHEKFDANFLINDERQKKIRIAQAFEVYVGEKRQVPADSFTTSELWHSSILFLQRHKVLISCSAVAIVLLAVFVPRLKVPPAPNNALTELNARRVDLERQLEQLNRYDDNTQPALEAILQSKQLREDGETQKLVVPKNTRFIRLKLQLPAGIRHERYGVIVQTVEGDELFKVNDLKTDTNGAVVLKLTSGALPPGDYQIQLMGGTSLTVMRDVARYNLRLIHDTSS